MSLIAWYPLNGNLNNQGLDGETKQANVQADVAVDNNGKIGKCYTNTSTTCVPTPINLDSDSFTIASWVRLNAKKSSLNRAISLMNANGGYISLGCEHNNGTALGFHCYGAISSICIFDMYPANIKLRTWVHYAMTYGNGEVCVYENGKLIYNDKNVSAQHVNMTNLYLFGYNYGSAMASSLNDVRVYDNAISASEVKELSKGLVCHYLLNGTGFGNENLLKTSERFTESNKLTVSKNVVDGYYEIRGLNTYDVELSDGIYTMQYCTDTLMGDSHPPAHGLQVIWLYLTKKSYATAGVPFDIALRFFSSNPSMKCEQIEGGYRYTFQYTVSGYKGISIRVNLSSRDGTTVTSKFWNFKLERGSVATPWCPNKNDALYSALHLGEGIEYDCSGLGNNGTIVGDLKFDVDSPRYNGSTDFNQTGYIKNNNFKLYTNQFTMSFWVKAKLNTSQHFLFGTFNNWTNNGLGIFRGSQDFYFRNIMRSDSENLHVSIDFMAIEDTWMHISFVYTGTEVKIYENGNYARKVAYGKDGNVYHPLIYIGNSLHNNAPNSETEEAQTSDFRFYVTALSDEDIKELYNSRMTISSTANLLLHGEVIEQ